MQQVVWNLLSNAVKFTESGGRVSVTTCSRDGRSTVEVVNDGEVLDPAVLPTLLEPFQRIDRGARGDGAGLGLSIVRSVAQAHGGAVSLAVCPDGGLRATVTLPRGEAAEPTQPDRYCRERAHA